jgi:hypothetical protein
MSRKIIGVTVGTPISVAKIGSEIKPEIKEYVDEEIAIVREEAISFANDAFETANSALTNSEMNQQRIESLNNDVSILWEHVDANADKTTKLENQMGDVKNNLEKQYELIEEITLEEAAAALTRIFGKDGEAYNLSALRVSVKIPVLEDAHQNHQLIFSFNTVANDYKLYHQAAGAFSTSSETNTYLVAKNDHGIMDYYVVVCTGNSEYNHRVKANYVNLPWENIVRLNLSTYPSTILLPVGTKITIYGIKENTNET